MIKLEVAISLSRVIDFIHDDVALTGRKNWGKNYNYIPIQVILKLSFHDLQNHKNYLVGDKICTQFQSGVEKNPTKDPMYCFIIIKVKF